MPRSIPASVSADLAPVASLPTASVLRSRPVGAGLVSIAGKVGLTLTTLLIASGLLGPLVAPHDPFAITGGPLAAPSGAHWMGTDALGRDLFSGLLYGARTSVTVGVVVVSVALVVGVGIGLMAGYRGGWVDDTLMRITEMFQVLPRFFLAIVTVALFGPGLDRVILVLAVTSWPTLARVVRGEVMAMRDLDFVRAAEASGASPSRVLRQELLPNVMPSVLVLLGLLFGQALLVEASIGFLGLGDPNTVSWGGLAGQAQSYLRVAWWLPLFPGAAITIAVLGSNLLADGLAAGPRRQERRVINT